MGERDARPPQGEIGNGLPRAAHSRYSAPGASDRLSRGDGLCAATVTEEREEVGYRLQSTP